MVAKHGKDYFSYPVLMLAIAIYISNRAFNAALLDLTWGPRYPQWCGWSCSNLNGKSGKNFFLNLCSQWMLFIDICSRVFEVESMD
jgi:hypothetical protein